MHTADRRSLTAVDIAPTLRDRFFVFRKKVEPPRLAQERTTASCWQPIRMQTDKFSHYVATVQPPNCPVNRIVCGKTPAYPQQQMCRSRFFAGQTVFVQDRFKLDTMLFQLIRQHVNR